MTQYVWKIFSGVPKMTRGGPSIDWTAVDKQVNDLVAGGLESYLIEYEFLRASGFRVRQPGAGHYLRSSQTDSATALKAVNVARTLHLWHFHCYEKSLSHRQVPVHLQKETTESMPDHN